MCGSSRKSESPAASASSFPWIGFGGRYVWDKQPGHYFLEWWEGRKRRRELAGVTPSQVLEAQRRKTNELIGEMFTGATHLKPPEEGGTATPITKALELFAEHVKTHSPAKPATHQRYHQVLAHFERVLGKKKYMEAITRSDMDDYKITRSRELFVERPVSPATINFEMTILRALFYYLICERGMSQRDAAPLEGRGGARGGQARDPAQVTLMRHACSRTAAISSLCSICSATLTSRQPENT